MTVGEGRGKVTVTHQEGLRFVARDSKGHELIIDAAKETGGSDAGFSPTRLLLASFGACTAMDVISILRKRRQAVTSLIVEVSGQQAEGLPARFEKVHAEYIIRGKGVDRHSVELAIRLSEDAYCSVGATLREETDVTTSYLIEEESVGRSLQD